MQNPIILKTMNTFALFVCLISNTKSNITNHILNSSKKQTVLITLLESKYIQTKTQTDNV